jgi:hypothetical protein
MLFIDPIAPAGLAAPLIRILTEVFPGGMGTRVHKEDVRHDRPEPASVQKARATSQGSLLH